MYALTATAAVEHRRLLHINDVMTKVLYLVNTDTKVCVIPASTNERSHE